MNTLTRIRHFIRYSEWEFGWEYWPRSGRFCFGPVLYYDGLNYFGIRILKAYMCVTW